MYLALCKLSYLSVQFIYSIMVEHSISALKVVLVSITIYPCVIIIFVFEMCPKLRKSDPNFGQTLIRYHRPKLHLSS